MKNQEMISLMSSALDDYGEFALALENKTKILDKTVTDRMTVQNISLQRVREAVIRNGEVLEYNEEQNILVTVINTGLMNAVRALVVLKLSNTSLDFAAYAKEDLIKQNLAQKTIDAIRSDLL